MLVSWVDRGVGGGSGLAFSSDTPWVASGVLWEVLQVVLGVLQVVLGALRVVLGALWVVLGALQVVLEAALVGFVAIVCAANIGVSDGNYESTT